MEVHIGPGAACAAPPAASHTSRASPAASPTTRTSSPSHVLLRPARPPHPGRPLPRASRESPACPVRPARPPHPGRPLRVPPRVPCRVPLAACSACPLRPAHPGLLGGLYPSWEGLQNDLGPALFAGDERHTANPDPHSPCQPKNCSLYEPLSCAGSLSLILDMGYMICTNVYIYIYVYVYTYISIFVRKCLQEVQLPRYSFSSILPYSLLAGCSSRRAHDCRFPARSLCYGRRDRHTFG